MTDTQFIPDVSDPELEEDDPIHSHIVRGEKGRSADTIIVEARVLGTPVTALCGHVWVPSRNPEQHPVCSRCVEVLKAMD
jgi:hypothetical protein